MIPTKFLSKIGSQEVEIGGVKVKACHVTDNTHVIESKINQLMAALNRQRPVVGVDVKVTMGDQKKQQNTTADLLILFGGNCCLVINLAHLPIFPHSLCNFLADNNICFVSIGLHDKLGGPTLSKGSINVIQMGRTGSGRTVLQLGHVVEVGDLAARVLKKPNLSKCGLEELHKQVRRSTVATDLPDQTCPSKRDSKASVSTAALPGTGGGGGARPNWKAMVFSDEELRHVIHDAYVCFVIGDKMLEILDAGDHK